MSDDAEPNELDVPHVAELANLPLDDAEIDEMQEACREVLEAFQLPETDAEETDERTSRTFADDPDPWPREGVDAIVDQFPQTDGRQLNP